jgi:ABC-type multidrug transport system permease subunit
MKFLDIFFNYIRFIRKQGSTSWLILLYPILLIMVVGIGLNIGSSDKVTVAIYGKKINIFLDPTKQAVTSNLLLLVDKAVNEEKYKSGASLGAIQEKLAPSVIELRTKRGEMELFLLEISDIKTNVSKTKQELVEARSKLTDYRSDLLSYKSDLSKIDYYQQKLTSYDNSLSALSYSLTQKENERNSLSYKLSNDINKIDIYINDVNDALTNVYNAKTYSTSPSTDYYLDQIESELLTLRSDLYTARSDLVSIRSELNSIDFNSMKTSVSALRSDIISTKNDLGAFKTKAMSEIDAMLVEIDATDAKISSSIDALSAFETKLGQIETKVRQTKNLIDKVISPLEEFLGKKPEELLPPEIESKSVFPEELRWIDMFFPSIIGIDILLASLLLPMIMKVRMREQGVELRMLRSKAGTLSVIVGETMANYLVAFFQLLLIFIFGIVFFGVKIVNPTGFLVVLITLPVVFTSLGVFLSQIIKRSSTAFLLSLLIGIPMIFISGTIIPLEFLNPLISAIGSIAPLYRVIDFTEMLFFRNASLIDALGNYLYLISFTGFNVLLAMFAYYLKR